MSLEELFYGLAIAYILIWIIILIATLIAIWVIRRKFREAKEMLSDKSNRGKLLVNLIPYIPFASILTLLPFLKKFTKNKR